MCQPPISKRPFLKENTCIHGHIPSADAEHALREYEQEIERKQKYYLSKEWFYNYMLLWIDLVMIGILMYYDVDILYIFGIHVVILSALGFKVLSSKKTE
jgi:hypothetical protein